MKINKFNFGLYPVVTEEFCNGRSLIYVLQEIISGGAKIVQLRQKNSTKKQIYEMALKYREITKKKGVTFILNDYIDIALAVKADGVHLGQDDMPCQAARLLSKNLIIGISTHSQQEMIEAEKDKATYINIGPIFSTNTKVTKVNPLGLDYLKNIKTTLPFSVMGGIKSENIKDLLGIGVKNIAMVTEITMSRNIKAKVEDLMKLFSEIS